MKKIGYYKQLLQNGWWLGLIVDARKRKSLWRDEILIALVVHHNAIPWVIPSWSQLADLPHNSAPPLIQLKRSQNNYSLARSWFAPEIHTILLTSTSLTSLVDSLCLASPWTAKKEELQQKQPISGNQATYIHTLYPVNQTTPIYKYTPIAHPFSAIHHHSARVSFPPPLTHRHIYNLHFLE